MPPPGHLWRSKVTLSVGHGALDLSGVTGLAFAAGDGAADAAMTLTGTTAAINSGARRAEVHAGGQLQRRRHPDDHHQ